MNTNNLNIALKPFFDELNIDELEMGYNEKLNRFMSKTSFMLYEDDDLEYFMVVNIFNTAGSVFIGYTDGINFYKTKTLGQVFYKDDHWESL